MEFNIIGDIAGQYETLLALLDKMPNAVPLSVGDMIDRGPNSVAVVEFFMSRGQAILGNHEHMCSDHFSSSGYYESGLWLEYNGGHVTYDELMLLEPRKRECILKYLSSLPKHLETEEG